MCIRLDRQGFLWPIPHCCCQMTNAPSLDWAVLDVGFSRLKTKRRGLVDDFQTFLTENPDLKIIENVSG